MKRSAFVVAILAGLTSVALAQADVQPVNPAKFRKLNCDQIAGRIQALNVPIGNANSTWDTLRRNPTPQFFLLGIQTPNPEYDQMLARARGERQALIKVAVEKDCASKRLVR